MPSKKGTRMTDLNLTKQLISKQVFHSAILNYRARFEGIQKTYFYTNENIKEYIDYAKINSSTKCLSVMASGDHAFNLVTKGAKVIDTFDINRLTEYFSLGFKRALILKNDYYEFINICNLISDEKLSLDDTCDLINDLLPYMDKKYSKFWLEIMNYNYWVQKNNKRTIDLFHMLCLITEKTNGHSKNNLYLKSVQEYNLLRNNLGNANISFKELNITELSDAFRKNKYDVMMLSNILDYVNLDVKSFNELAKSLESMMNKEGILFLKYIFLYGKTFLRTHLFTEESDNLTVAQLKDFEIIKIPRANAIIVTDTLKIADDGMILKRIK